MAGRFTFALLLLVLGQGIESASREAKNPHIFGFYEVLDATRIDQETKVVLRLRLLNPGAQAVSVESLTLFSLRPMPAQISRAPILLKAHKAQNVVREFTIATSEYESWRRGVRPLLRVEMRDERNDQFAQTVPLGRAPSREER